MLTDHHREIYDAPNIGGDDPGKGFDDFLADDRMNGAWVAEVDGAVAGLAGLYVAHGAPELEPLVVHPGHRNQGVARALVDVVTGECRTRGFSYLSVNPVARNLQAIGAYKSLGFDVVGDVELLLWLGDRERRWIDDVVIGDIRLQR